MTEERKPTGYLMGKPMIAEFIQHDECRPWMWPREARKAYLRWLDNVNGELDTVMDLCSTMSGEYSRQLKEFMDRWEGSRSSDQLEEKRRYECGMRILEGSSLYGKLHDFAMLVRFGACRDKVFPDPVEQN